MIKKTRDIELLTQLAFERLDKMAGNRFEDEIESLRRQLAQSVRQSVLQPHADTVSGVDIS